MPWRGTGCCNPGTRTRSMVGYRSMKRKESLASSPTNTVGTAGGRFEEYEAMKEELLETLRAGPGEAARREVAVAKTGPAPSRRALRQVRASGDRPTRENLRGGGR